MKTDKAIKAADMLREIELASNNPMYEELEVILMHKAEIEGEKAKSAKALKAGSTSSYSGTISSFWSYGTNNVEISFNGIWRDFHYSNSDQYNAMVMLALYAFNNNRRVYILYDNDYVLDLYVY